MFAVCCAGLLVYGATKSEDAPVVEKRNVSVIKRVSKTEWAMSDDQGPFLYTACADFPNETVIWAGYVARKARWQEFGRCKSIRRQDLGFWWDRDEHFNVKEIPQ